MLRSMAVTRTRQRVFQNIPMINQTDISNRFVVEQGPSYKANDQSSFGLDRHYTPLQE